MSPSLESLLTRAERATQAIAPLLAEDESEALERALHERDEAFAALAAVARPGVPAGLRARVVALREADQVLLEIATAARSAVLAELGQLQHRKRASRALQVQENAPRFVDRCA